MARFHRGASKMNKNGIGRTSVPQLEELISEVTTTQQKPKVLFLSFMCAHGNEQQNNN